MSETLDLLDWRPPPIHRGGATYVEEFDDTRLNAQQARVWAVMKSGEWKTLRQISDITGDGEASISARLRDFRKMGLDLDRQRDAQRPGLHWYRVRETHHG